MSSQERVEKTQSGDIDSLVAAEQDRMQTRETNHRMQEAARFLKYFEGLGRLGIAEESVERFAKFVSLDDLEAAKNGLEIVIAAKRKSATKVGESSLGHAEDQP